jgi:hypothetical protein
MDELSEFEHGALLLYSEAPQECARFVREALALLNEQQRRTIELVHFEGLNLKDVAGKSFLPGWQTNSASHSTHLPAVRQPFNNIA